MKQRVVSRIRRDTVREEAVNKRTATYQRLINTWKGYDKAVQQLRPANIKSELRAMFVGKKPAVQQESSAALPSCKGTIMQMSCGGTWKLRRQGRRTSCRLLRNRNPTFSSTYGGVGQHMEVSAFVENCGTMGIRLMGRPSMTRWRSCKPPHRVCKWHELGV